MEILKWLRLVLPYLKLLQDRLRSYDSRVQELNNSVNNLKKNRKRVERKVKEEENRYGRGIDEDIMKWLKQVDGIISEYDNFKEDEDHPYAACSNGYLPKPGIRYRLSRTVNDIISKVDVLLQTTKLDNFSYWLGSPSFDADFSNIDYESFESRNQTMDAVMEALADSSVRMIGVYGWNGVGKTTLVKEVAKQVKDSMFDVVVMVNVAGREIRRIQGQIADKLGMKLEEESESGRGARIRERLTNPKENTLVILDDLKVKLDFNMLGIPYGKDGSGQMNQEEKPSTHSMKRTENYAMKTEKFDASCLEKTEEPLSSYKGCKFLMISDSKQLLLSQVDWKEIQTFYVGPIAEKEAEKLFKDMAEIGDENTQFKTLATQIAKKCGGLPMMIVTTARALKSKGLAVWEDAYRKLERQNLTAMPGFYTKLSYGLLEDEELKSTFLICASMGRDALISDLVRYCIGLGLLQEIYTVREARDRVHMLVGKLKELSLLSDSFSTDRFTMQDIIHREALSIASKDMHAFVLTKGKLDEWPDEDNLQRYTAISLQHCGKIEFPNCITCPRLRVFHLDNNDPHLKIPDSFFNEMKELKVLILTGINLSPLPLSIECLTKLRMICLERCKLGGKLSIIGELKNLRVLSISGSDIDRLPTQLKQLTKLQIFDISNCSKLEVIPANVISSLTSLEELYMRNCSIQWNDERQGYRSENASLSELMQLNQLMTLDIQIPKIIHLPKDLFFDKLDSYKIVVRDFKGYPIWEFKMLETYEASRVLELQLENGFDIHSQKEIKMLFERVENLLLGQLNDVEDIFYDLNYEGFPHLKYLSIVNNSKVKSIINSESQQHYEKAFPKLEFLFLYEVHNMEHICHSQLTNESFCKLKIIKLKICGQLKNVFFLSMIKHLSALETIEVSECYSLKEIVTLETKSINDEIKFPELRSLTLQSLPEFIGFYNISTSKEEQVLNRKPNELFDGKIVVSKLERMELSSIKIQKIWSDQPLTGSYFQNLIQLDVNDCGNLRYLLSFSMARSLINLQSLFVSECGMMENILVLTQKEVSMIEKENILPKLKNINLSSLKRLRSIWHSKVASHSFSKLDTLIIEKCNKLENVFPSYMIGKFQNLCSLRVVNCKSVKQIFDYKGCRQDIEEVSKLQNIHIEALPKLEHVWSNDSDGILNFKNLQNIWVQECRNLKNIFPVSVAAGLLKLEYLVIWDCGQLKEIVTMEETINKSSISLEFPKLGTIRFSKLPNLERFYGGTHPLSCSALSDLSVELCPRLELFRTENTYPEKKSAFLLEEVIYNLKSMHIEPHDANSLRRYIGTYRMHKLEEFHLARLKETEILYFFLHRNPNLKSILLSSCSFEELAPPGSLTKQKSGVVPKLKSLKLINLPSLKKIGFEKDTILFQRLECLVLKECPCLNTIAPSSVSFTCLTNLEVSNCNKLSYLMAPSTAKSLVQLATIKVIQCESLQTIISEQANKEEIVFRQLKEIELVSLRDLESFCISNRCAFKFPSLEKIVVSECNKMKIFTASELVNCTPVLRQIHVVHGKEEKRCYLEVDLNATIQFLYNNQLDSVNKAFDLMTLQHVRILKLAHLKLRSLAIPFTVYANLKNLEDLQIYRTNLEVIFGMKDIKMKGNSTLPLKGLTLNGLPKLKHVWDNDREGILCFQNLHKVLVTNCKNLQTLFPMELAEKLEKLEKLEISHCKKVREIVGKEEAATEATKEFSFPQLTSLDLCMLPQLINFYPGSFTLECPKLNHLEVLYCGKLEIFQTQQEAHPGVQDSSSANRQPLFIHEVVNLESFKLDYKNTKMLRNQHLLRELVELELDFGDIYEVSSFELVKLLKASNLEYLQVSRCRGLKELFPSQLKDEIAKLGQLKTLSLVELIELESIGLQHKWLEQVCKELQELSVSSCPLLITLVPSAVSFSNLKQLFIKDCRGLKHLFTSSTAKGLVHLEEMYIVRCFSMEKILAEEADRRTSEAIKFERLNTIVLDSLFSLVCFYSGSDTLQLSSLIKVLIWQCPNMEIFSQGVIHAEYFLGIQVSLDPNEDLLFHTELNTTVNQMFKQREAFESLALRGKVGLQNKWLCNLVILKLDKLNLPYAIPFSILSYLKNLKELEVQNSNKVKVIFDMKDTEIMETPFRLKKLALQGLSELTHVWKNKGQGILSFQNLQLVFVSGCNNLQTLFPAALAKNLKKLGKLQIQYCDRMLEIVGKEDDAAADITKKFLFPHLTWLELCHLPQLTYFYPGEFTLECPFSIHLEVSFCDKLDLEAFRSELETHPKNVTKNQDSSILEENFSICYVSQAATSSQILQQENQVSLEDPNENLFSPYDPQAEAETWALTVGGEHAHLPFCKKLRSCIERGTFANNQVKSIHMEKDIFGSSSSVEYLGEEQIKEVIHYQRIGVTVVCIYIRCLYHTYLIPRQITGKFLFINPHDMCTLTLDVVGQKSQMIADLLIRHKEINNKLILAPWNVGEHWVLVALHVCYSTLVVYYLDPLLGDPNNYPNMKQVINQGLTLYCIEIGVVVPNNFKWIQIKCPRQNGTIDCGYYVLRFMREIVSNKECMIPETCFPNLSCNSYSQHQLNEVREEWACFVLENCLR